MSDEEMRYAGFGDRSAAFVIDAIIVGTLFCYLLEGVVYAGQAIGPLLFAGTAAAFGEPEMPALFGSALAGAVLFVLLCWLYSAGVTSSQYAGTFGKMIMGMRVVDTSGERLTFRHATIRFLAKILSGLVLLIGFFMILFSETKQGLHDRFCGTYVVYKNAVPQVPPDAGPTVTKAMTEKAEAKEAESRSSISSIIWLLALIPLITIFLAAVIAAFVFGMAGNVSPAYVVAATAQQPDAATIIVTYQGGQDSAKLASLEVLVDDQIPVRWDSPRPGDAKKFTGEFSGKDHVIATGTFTDGSERVILDTYV